MIGILTEKPSAARNFATALGGMTGTYNGESYRIVHARGHLYEFLDPHQMVPSTLSEQYRSWDPKFLPWDETKFSWKRKTKDGVSGTLSDIKSGLAGCDEVVIATDVDPSGEGELLAWEILDELNIRCSKFSRMYFTDESEKEIQKAFVSRKVIPSMLMDMDYVKADYRAKWDMLSMQFTRIATNCAPDRSVLRQGRLKSVMVRIVGDGLAAVKNYKKVTKYTNKFKDENGVIYTNPKEPICDKKSDVSKQYHVSDVVRDSATMKHTAPPKLIDLATLSSKLSSKGIKAKDVLAVYQKMYEAKVVSYPRTEDKVITPEQFNDLLPLVDKIAAVVGVDVKLLTHRIPRSTHVKTGGAHGANRPGPNVPASLASLAQYGACGPAIYEILAKSYLAMLAEDYEYESQKGHIKDFPDFKGSASVPKKLGWKEIYNYDLQAGDDDNAAGLGTRGEPYIADVVNPKPPTPSMDWLMKKLENSDVGTGATRTSTYADVTSDSAKYPLLVDKKGKLSMSQYGEMSYILLAGTMIGDVKSTEQLFGEMREIAEGKLDPDVGLKRVQDMVLHDLQIMTANVPVLRAAMPDVKDAGSFVKKDKYEGIWKGKQVSFSREWSGHYFTDDECERLCKGEEIEINGLVSKAGKTYGVVGNLAKQKFNGRSFVGFNRLRFAGSGTIPDEFCKHRFSDKEKADLQAGKVVSVQGMVSKAGKVFDAKLKYGAKPDGSTGFSFVND